MNRWLHLAFFGAWLAPAPLTAGPEDWRLQMLVEHGMEIERLNPEDFEKIPAVSEARFSQLVPLLGSEDFKTRERAQEQIHLMGVEVIPWLHRLPEPDDPEIAFRLNAIRMRLDTERQWPETELLRHAMMSLTRERTGKPRDPQEPFVFAEWFRDEANTLDGGYRHFAFDGDEGLGGKVSDGALRMYGDIPREGDQRLILKPDGLIGNAVFPDDMRIEVFAMGQPGGEGTHHLGVSIGNVRALFHPGHRGGGFRFQRVDNQLELTRNEPMGFTPETGTFAFIGINVRRLRGGKVGITATVGQEGNERIYRNSIEVSEDVIGPLDSISLDRSGRQGGDAVFKKLVVAMN